MTLRSSLRSLRTQLIFPTLRDAISDAARASRGFRVVEFSVQGNHLHLLVEASSAFALSAGMRGLAIRIARRVNQLLSRRGGFWADRWHGRALTSPRAVRNALIAVLNNRSTPGASPRKPIDPYSSAPYFRGFKEFADAAPISSIKGLVPAALTPPRTPPVVPPHTWLLRQGWRQQRGALSVSEAPSEQTPAVPRALPPSATSGRARSSAR
ncbi:MAG TPA: transposase [Polyangiaceae bacterium]|nr:transposase [Polyangiaceae bacterium]